MNSSVDVRYRLRRDSLAWSSLGDDAVLVQLERDEIHVANHAGALLVRALTDGATIEELVTLLVDTFEVPTERAREDVVKFIEQLLVAHAIDE